MPPHVGSRCCSGSLQRAAVRFKRGPPRTVVPSPKSSLNHRFDKERDADTRYEALIAGAERRHEVEIVPLVAEQFDEVRPTRP